MDLFSVVTFIHDIEVGFSDLVNLFQEFFRMRGIVNRMLRDLQSGNDLMKSVDGNGGFQEPFSRLTRSPRIVVAGIRSGES